jgi:hypothetical protein
VYIHTSTVVSCTLNSSIDACLVTNSALHETPLDRHCSVKACKITTSPLALGRFLPEIRDLIFGYTMRSEDGRTTPPLLAVLWGILSFIIKLSA